MKDSEIKLLISILLHVHCDRRGMSIFERRRQPGIPRHVWEES